VHKFKTRLISFLNQTW